MRSKDDFDAFMAIADERLDKGDYPAARDAYRRVAVMRPPSETTLDKLRVAEENTRLMFLRELEARFPDDVGVARELILALVAVRRAKNGMVTCNKFIAQHPDGQSRLRGLRLGLAVEGGGARYVAEDFEAIWTTRQNVPGTLRSLLEGLGRLAGGNDALAALRALAKRFADEPLVSELVAAKIGQLEALDRALARVGASTPS